MGLSFRRTWLLLIFLNLDYELGTLTWRRSHQSYRKRIFTLVAAPLSLFFMVSVSSGSGVETEHSKYPRMLSGYSLDRAGSKVWWMCVAIRQTQIPIPPASAIY